MIFQITQFIAIDHLSCREWEWNVTKLEDTKVLNKFVFFFVRSYDVFMNGHFTQCINTLYICISDPFDV